MNKIILSQHINDDTVVLTTRVVIALIIVLPVTNYRLHRPFMHYILFQLIYRNNRDAISVVILKYINFC